MKKNKKKFYIDNSKWYVTDTKIKGQALSIFPDGKMLIYYKGLFDLFDLNAGKTINHFHLPCPTWKMFLVKNRFFERLLHMNPRWALPTSDTKAYIFYNHNLFHVDCSTGLYEVENLVIKGQPLSLTKIKNITGFQDSYVTGDYWTNSQRAAVCIYQKCAKSNWKKVYTFPAKSVRHIHGIISDEINNSIMIMTGDENNESGIWIAKDNFKIVKPLIVGKQAYRTCQILPKYSGFYYLSDSPSEKNYIREFSNNQIKDIASIRGTCIYGYRNGSLGFYSTTCEPDAHAKNKLIYWLTNKPGKGIAGRHIDVFSLQDGKITLISQFEHDRLPLRLFQYGTATFANGQYNDEYYYTPTCVRYYDMHILKISKKT